MITRRLLWIAATAGALHVTPPGVRRRTRLAAATVSTTTERTLAVASNRGDLRAAAELCGVAFPPASADEHFRVLSDPACLANVFFDVRGRASVALLREDGLSIGCAQVVPCAVRKEASSSSIGKPVLWVQCLCVTPTSRRTGAARSLMAWAEREASSAAQASGVSDAEIWLAVQEANNAARSLYEGLGFVSDEGGLRLGHAVMRKSVPAAAAVTGDPRGPAATFDLVAAQTPSGGPPLDKALQEAAPAGLVGVVALLGASALVAPFCYGGLGEPAPLAMWKSWIGGPFSVISDVALGLVVACGAEFARKTLSNDDTDDDPVAALEQNPSLAGQKAALWRVTGAATASPADAITAIAAWQLLVALSEELYYRGLIQNGAYHAVGAATGSGLVGDAVSLLGTSALFAVAHAGFVQDVEDGEGEMSQSEMVMDWITDVAPFGAMLALEFAVTGHRIVAPLATHTALNTYWSALDAAKLRAAPDRERLAALLGEAKS
jgi:membrane protease YdiL (CAAX protease family)/ribosomal protein S18 acetylase RimI-like enzyme